jgi:hypothetical protein
LALGHHSCADCKTKSPETELGYSLTLNLAGWRETRHPDGKGDVTAEWRCPDCWRKFKHQTSAKTQFNLPSINTIKKV